jgi:hypothetical protein
VSPSALMEPSCQPGIFRSRGNMKDRAHQREVDVDVSKRDRSERREGSETKNGRHDLELGGRERL